MSAARLRCYLSGGRPDGARRTYDGGRDQAPPTGDVRLTLPGSLLFAGRSSVWGGALAFLDTEADGEVVARAYRLTFGQLSDLVSQEARHPVGTDLSPAEESGEPWPTPSGVYESVVRLGERDGEPLFTLTSFQTRHPAPPSAAYLRTILTGLAEVTDWSAREQAAYLLRARGVALAWDADRLVELATSGPDYPRRHDRGAGDA